MGYLEKQDKDIVSFKKDESVIIPDGIDYKKLSGLSNEIKTKLLKVKPKTLGSGYSYRWSNSCSNNYSTFTHQKTQI